MCDVTCASTARRTRRRVPRHAPFAADGALIPPERARLSSDGAGEFLSEVLVVCGERMRRVNDKIAPRRSRSVRAR